MQNQGSEAAAASWYDSVYLSPRSLPDWSDYGPNDDEQSTATMLANISRSSTLNAGADYTQSANVTVPNVAPGAYYVLFVTNDPNQGNADYFDNYGRGQGESDYADNVVAVPVTIASPQLVPSAVSATPATVEAGNNATLAISWQVTNNGSVGAFDGWTDYVYLSNSPTLDTSGATQLTTAPDQSVLATDASYTTNLTGVIVPNLPAGNYYLFVVADADNGQDESDTAASVSSPVEITLTAPAVDLASSNPVLPSTSLVLGQNLKVFLGRSRTREPRRRRARGTTNVYLSTKSTLDASATSLTSSYWTSGLSSTVTVSGRDKLHAIHQHHHSHRVSGQLLPVLRGQHPIQRLLYVVLLRQQQPGGIHLRQRRRLRPGDDRLAAIGPQRGFGHPHHGRGW